jgi:hypothetical protein
MALSTEGVFTGLVPVHGSSVWGSGQASACLSGECHFFYFLSPRLSTVFVISDETGSELYKIESDYLDKAGIKAIFSEYL